MSRRFAPTKSSNGNDQLSPHLLAFDTDNNDKARWRKTKKQRNTNTALCSLTFQRLLLKARTRRDFLLPVSALLLCFVLILFNVLKQSTVVGHRMPRSSISQQDLHRYYSTTHPISIRFDNPSENIPREVRHHRHHHTKRKNQGWTKEDEKRQKELWSEEEKDDYGEYYEDEENLLPEPYEGMPECKPMHNWQTKQFPTCTIVHEQPLNGDTFGKYLAKGAFRQTFEIYDFATESPVAMKTIRDRPNRNFFTPYYMERHRIDALIYERTTSSPWITDMYGFCGYSGLFEFAGGGTLEDAILNREDKDLEPLTRIQKLSLAVEVTSAIADLHTIESINGSSAMIHGDLKLNQFVRIGSRYKLNDFNRGHLMYWDDQKEESCPYAWDDGHNGFFRAPEEYKVELLSEKVDVFSLGNFIYCIMTGLNPFDKNKFKLKEVQKIVKKGILPPVKKEYRESDNSIDRALLKAFGRCLIYRWQDRAKAYEVRNMLLLELKKQVPVRGKP